jgi:hypothetical protein
VSTAEQRAVDLLVRQLGATIVGTAQQVVLDKDEAHHRPHKEASADMGEPGRPVSSAIAASPASIRVAVSARRYRR